METRIIIKKWSHLHLWHIHFILYLNRFKIGKEPLSELFMRKAYTDERSFKVLNNFDGGNVDALTEQTKIYYSSIHSFKQIRQFEILPSAQYKIRNMQNESSIPYLNLTKYRELRSEVLFS